MYSAVMAVGRRAVRGVLNAQTCDSEPVSLLALRFPLALSRTHETRLRFQHFNRTAARSESPLRGSWLEVESECETILSVA